MRNRLLIPVFICGLMLSTSGAWVYAKAELSQILLNHAWKKSVSTQTVQKPWPWADTWPVARLIIPEQNKQLIILQGGSGEAMAFGPSTFGSQGWPNLNNTIAIGGHRDTHLKFLKSLKMGDQLWLETIGGTVQKYQLQDTTIADASKQQLEIYDQHPQLILVTCYPFEQLQARGNLRYIAVAEPFIKNNSETTIYHRDEKLYRSSLKL